MPTAYNLTPEKLAVYRATAQRRREQERSELDHRREQAWAVARQAALLLKTQFKIYAFEFDPERVKRLVQMMPSAFEQPQIELLTFAKFLEQVGRDG